MKNHVTRICLYLALSRIQTPLPLWKNEEFSNTCSIFCRTAQFTALQSCIIRVCCIAMHIGAIYWLLSILQSIGCLPSTKSTHHNLLLLLLLHTYLLLCDEWPNPPFARLCITNCAASSVYCAMCNAHLAGGDFVQCVIKEYYCFITRLRLPILSLHQHVQLQVQMFAHVQVLAQWKSSQEKSSQGRGHFPVHLFVLFGPFFFFKIDASKICF